MSHEANEEEQYYRELRGIAKGTIVGFGEKVGAKLVWMASTLVMTRTLGAEGFGLFGWGRTVSTMAAHIGAIGLPQAVVRFVSMADTEGDKARSRRIVGTCTLLSVVANLIGALLIMVFAGPLATDVIKKPAVAPILVVMALAILPFSISAIWVSGPIARRSMNAHAITELGRDVLVLIGAALLALTVAPTPLQMSWVWTIACVGGLAIAGRSLFRFFRGLSWRDIDLGIVWMLLAYSFPILMIAVLNIGFYKINILLGGRMLTKADLGFYILSASIAELVVFGAAAVASIFQPTIASLHKQDKIRELDKVFQTATRWTWYLTMPVAVVLMMKGARVLELFGTDFVSGLSALNVLVVGQLICASAASAGAVLVMSGKQWYYTIIGTLMVVLNVVLCLVLVPTYGAFVVVCRLMGVEPEDRNIIETVRKRLQTNR